MSSKILRTAVVGSYPQPDWLVDREMLSKIVPRVRMPELWRVEDPWLEQAQDDATVLAIRDMERAGIDVITDGEIRRESYSNRFASELEGIDCDRPGFVRARSDHSAPVPRVIGKLERTRPVELRDLQFLKANSTHTAKITLPGPFTMSKQAVDEHYGDPETLAMEMARIVNEEARDLQAAGADVIQLDEPWVRHDPEGARIYAVKAINRALEGLTIPTVIHLCFGYAAVVPGETKPAHYTFLAELADTNAETISMEAAQPNIDLGVLKDLAPKNIMLGVIDLSDAHVETVDVIAGRIREGLKYTPPDRLMPAPDCGMKYLPRSTAFGKLKSMADAAAMVRQEIS